MPGRGLRGVGFGLLATAGAGLLGLTSMMHAAFACGDDTALIMGTSGLPIPGAGYIADIADIYLAPYYPGYTPQGLVTPEQVYPSTGVHSLPLDTSLSQGVTILNDAILQNFSENNGTVVVGLSQSATLASLELRQLAAQPPADRPDPSQLAFVLIGNPSNPNGGLLERFAGLSVPSLGVTFSGATPSDVYPTTIYTVEYDGAADFPQYPINLLSDLNAYAGLADSHGEYLDLTPTQIGDAIKLPTLGPTDTTYYMIPLHHLPLLNPLRAIPIVGNPLADLLQPDLTVLVNLGYGSITEGWSQGPANVPTPLGLFPTNISPLAVLEALGAGARQGVQNFLTDLGPASLSLRSLPDLSSLIATALPGVTGAATSPIDVVNTLTGVVSNDYAVLLPTADLGLALTISLPAYDAQLFVDGLEAGNLLDAIGLPIAADVALVPMVAGVELLTIAQAATTTVTDLLSLIP